ncbi:3-hydroxyacyl-CoA dehydrogenase NAD-binding domain-containing protein [Granulicella arctica]|uniref:3-hydroxybutyryl-CoA dehydrogenase n=1 Tax=Granulicella arctica TaxID=940613 RepID=A0A7Y9PIG9_9BACT|nr:3-hydroxyacyl-CoA dehydrogenase NAD-binding domain-containing protein [Granulicella arctica]NYF80461.1 3-hydroxybutyryl-CoA dehydrogenase [Granulicella arctica]
MPSTFPAHPIRTVAVIGAGKAGRSFALSCTAAGFHVVLEDVMPANLRQAEADFSDMRLHAAPGQLQLASTVEDAVHSADIAIDFVPDELESKLEILSLLDRMAPPRTILCTPTNTISITDLASCTYRPDRILAVRGTLGQHIRLLYPATAAPTALSTTEHFLQTIGNQVTPQPDPDLPMLMKNIVYTR